MSNDTVTKNVYAPYGEKYNTREDKIRDIIEKEYFSNLRDRGTFDAHILQGWNYDAANVSSVEQSGRYLAAYLRPVDFHSAILPPPCGFFNSLEEASYITTLHPIGISESPLVSSGMTFNVGDVVSCYFDFKAPAYAGQMRGLRFKLGKVVTPVAGNYQFDCLKSNQGKLGFNQVGGQLGGTGGPYTETIVGKCRTGKSPGWYINDPAAQQDLKSELLAAYPLIAPIVDDFISYSATIGLADPGWLANLINMESKWNTRAKNKDTHASGIIQWMPEYCPKLVGDPEPTGTDAQILAARRASAAKVREQGMSWQWRKVKRRYNRYKGKLKNSADVYTAVFYPWAVGKPLNTDVAGHWAGNRNRPKVRERRIAKFMRQNGGIRYKGDYARLASGKAKMPTRFC